MTRAKQIPADNQGIRGIWIEIQKTKKQAQKKAKKDAKEIFQLVMQEKAAPDALSGLVSQESLLELIYFTLDHRKAVTTSVNRRKSIDSRAKKAEKDRALVFEWCNKNPDVARKPYHHSLAKAAAATSIRQKTTIRELISVWRKITRKNKFFGLHAD